MDTAIRGPRPTRREKEGDLNRRSSTAGLMGRREENYIFRIGRNGKEGSSKEGRSDISGNGQERRKRSLKPQERGKRHFEHVKFRF